MSLLLLLLLLQVEVSLLLLFEGADYAVISQDPAQVLG